eukprot:Seg1641.18 transcript_id=Seg1641.18/GoldUCD/mRNA.D3Y31 product="DnaJ subfamily C member 25-like" protein_id=Seg1641.18/GoldUCD/D3Y31
MAAKRAAVKLLLIFIASFLTSTTYAQYENLYCGQDNCYDVLNVARDASKSAISKAYRKLARKYHPDIYKEADAEEVFRKIATAYETLKDEDARQDYDYMLDNPEYAYYHYYRYYKRKVSPKVDVRIVIAATLTVISILQYMHKHVRFNEAIEYAMQQPKFKNQAMKVAHDEGLLVKGKKLKGRKSKEERREEEARILREVVENSIDIRGGYSKPSLWEILWVQLLMSPYYIALYISWGARWVWKFWILKEEYGEEEKGYLTRKAIGLSELYWEAIDDYSRKEYLARELWIKENLKEFKEEQEEEMRVKMAENNKSKMWRSELPHLRIQDIPYPPTGSQLQCNYFRRKNKTRVIFFQYACYSDVETKLMEVLLNNYTALGRPVVSNNDAVHVTFDLKLHKIEKLLTKEQHLITHTFVVMRWREPRMVWDPSKHNGTNILNFASSSLWVPDIVLYNTADIGNNGPADFYKSPVHVYSNGTAVWFATVAWQSSCPVDITWFPVDQQLIIV